MTAKAGYWISAAIILAAVGFLVVDYFLPGKLISNAEPSERAPAKERKKSVAELIREAENRSQHVKGVYMTSVVAGDTGRAATKLRNDILILIDATEINGAVIDVKETEGGLIITDETRALIGTLHDKGAWVIARQTVFKDGSQEKNHPEWYLKRKSGALWRDRRGGSWLDPASPEVWQYQMSVAKSASDAGFDEIQLDYVRFPSDGDVENAIYPIYNAKRLKYEVLKEFFSFAHETLKRYRPELVLSADLFGYVAIQEADLGIGQRLVDIGDSFDYISLMVYPSHYYAGFQVAADPLRNLAAIFYPYQSPNVSSVASNNPYPIIYRSLLIARDTLDRKIATASPSGVATSSSPSSPIRTARLRPWLQDFDLGADTARSIRYDAEKVRAQIDAAEAAGASGWLLWNANNIYTKAALKPK